MQYYNNILETVGNTPLVKLNRIVKDIKGTVLAKYETFNPGNSIKDRMAIQMIEDAEADGKLKPGGTVIEGTSGNTGMGLALACVQKGYKLICTMPDKQSKEKMDILRAMGAEVIVTPTNVEPDDPRSYYSVARRMAQELPNSFYVNQYDNLANRKAHYLTTGPEIWEQTEGKITHFIVGVGTGGTVSGIGKYLKEKNPDIKIWGVDTYGSVFKKYHETGIFDENEIYSYLTEGIGEDILPKNVDFDVIDHFEKVTDKDGMVMTRRLAKEEGMFVGNSTGCIVQGLLQLKDEIKEDDVVVMIVHDHGSRYVGKIFNDDWMRDRGFLEKEKPKAISLVRQHMDKKLVTLEAADSVAEASRRMIQFEISQIPVVKEGKFVGAISDKEIFSRMVQNGGDVKSMPIESIMSEPFPIMDANASLEEMSSHISRENGAVMVDVGEGNYHIVTRHDIIRALGE